MILLTEIPNSIKPNKVWISEVYNLRFLGIPKCASTTVKTYLKMDNQKYFHDLAKGWHYENWPIFTFIRDPDTRFRSGCMEYAGRFKGRKAMSYSFMHNCLDKIEEDGFFDEHLIPQSWFCPEPEKLDFVFKVEKFDQAWRMIEREIGEAVEVKFRRNEYPQGCTLPRIDAALAKRIETIYENDYELYENF